VQKNSRSCDPCNGGEEKTVLSGVRIRRLRDQEQRQGEFSWGERRRVEQREEAEKFDRTWPGRSPDIA